MIDPVVWKHFSEEQINCLEAALECNKCKSLLASYLGLGRKGNGTPTGDGGNGQVESLGIGDLSDKERVVLDFHFYNYAFCKERRFDAKATSAFLSIMKDILDEDMHTDDAVSSLGTSFSRFEGMVLRHAVERPPWTIGVLRPEDVGAITDYATNSYYRHFHLYKHVFTTHVNVVLEQRHPHGIEEPETPLPLGTALPVVVNANSPHRKEKEKNMEAGGERGEEEAVR